MNCNLSATLDDFFEKLATLYSNVADWVRAMNLKVERTNIELNEEAFGKYTVEKCRIADSGGKRIAELLPVGASIIGAKYRVDMIGILDQEILVYFDEGGPKATTGVFEDAQTDKSTMSTLKMYRGVDEAGWYWVESQKLSRAFKVDQTLFPDLLSTVSDYDYQP